MNITEAKAKEETFTDLIWARRRATRIQQKPKAKQLQQRDNF